MSFVAAAFLAGLVTLALPWWLHRLETRDPRTRLVSSLLLMRPVEAPRQRHRTVRYRWLLVVRLLLLAVLTFAFAQPLLERAPGAAAAAPAVAPRVLVLDTSLSMAAVMDEARDRALGLIDDLPAGTEGAVIGAGAELTLLAGPTADHDALAAAVRGAAASATRLGFDGLLGRVATLVAGVSDAAAEVHLISDFQASAMPDRFNALVAGNDLPVQFHPLRARRDNWTLTGALNDGRLAVTVRSHADLPRRLTLVLESAAGELERTTLEVAAGASRSVDFAVAQVGGADRWLRARIDAADAIDGDDVLHVVAPGAGVIDLPVYVAAGAERQSDYLHAAVQAAAPRFRPGPAALQGPVAVVLDGGGLDAPEARRLRRHLAAGGGVLLSAGTGTRRSGALPFDGPALGDRLADPAAAGPRSVIGIDLRHPALGGAAAWREVQVYRHLVADAERDNVLLALDDGTPLLLEYPVDAGRVLALTTALDPQWSSLVTDPVFVALIGAALGYLAQEDLPRSAIAGEALSLGAANAQLFDSAGARLLSLGDSTAGGSLRVVRPGLYTLRTPNRERLLAVNPDPRESQSEPADPALLARWQAAATAGSPASAAPPAASAGPAWPLAPWLLALLLLLALLEPVMANQGRAGVGT